jgi:hypothetical protein
MSYSFIDLSENAQDKRYPVTNDFGLLYLLANLIEIAFLSLFLLSLLTLCD